MGQRHPLVTDGAWVELRDPTELLAGDRMDIEDSLTGPGAMKIQREMVDGLIKALVVTWQLPTPLPIPKQSPDSLRLLKIADYEKLKKLVEPAKDIVFPDDPEPKEPEAIEAAKADAGSPTGDADAS